jgi:K319L-like, PKD domain
VPTLTPAENLSPVANAGSDQVIFVTGKAGSATVTLDASGSRDPDGTIVSYQWLEGGVPIGTGKTVSVNLGLGTHTITLHVTDDDQASSEAQLIVEISKRGAKRK